MTRRSRDGPYWVLVDSRPASASCSFWPVATDAFDPTMKRRLESRCSPHLAGSPFVAALRAVVAETLGHRPEPFGFPSWTDAHNMIEHAGSEAVVFGPGPRLTTAHGPDEHIAVSDIVRCALVVRRLAWDVWRAPTAWPAC